MDGTHILFGFIIQLILLYTILNIAHKIHMRILNKQIEKSDAILKRLCSVEVFYEKLSFIYNKHKDIFIEALSKHELTAEMVMDRIQFKKLLNNVHEYAENEIAKMPHDELIKLNIEEELIKKFGDNVNLITKFSKMVDFNEEEALKDSYCYQTLKKI